MVWLFGQVWVLCAVAFLAGSAVTWLVFAVPQRRHAPVAPPARGPTAAWVPGRPADTEDAPPLPPPPPVAEPALASLDTSEAERPPRRAGTTAAEALDRLGVAGTAPEAAIDVPKQRTSGNDEDDR